MAATFLGKRPTQAELRQFSHSVSYFRYARPFSGSRSSRPVLALDAGTGEDLIFPILERLQPEVLVVLGASLWNRLPRPESDGWALQTPAGSVSTREYPYSGGSCRAFPVPHLGSARFDSRAWHARLTAVLRAVAVTTPVLTEPVFDSGMRESAWALAGAD
jgi:hypothetical protein